MCIPCLTSTQNNTVKKVALISALILLLCSCGKEAQQLPAKGQGWLCIDGFSVNASTKGMIDNDFGISILNTDGSPVQGKTFPAGSVPSKIALDGGNYILDAYSANIDNWKTADGGRGNAAYRQKEGFLIQPEMYSYVSIHAPHVNYAVRFRLEEGLEKWFKASSISVLEGSGRNVTLQQMQTGWFDASSVSVTISVTNTDNDSYTGKAYTLNGKPGHRYTLTYSLSPAEDGTSSINVTIDDEFEDGGEDIVIVN